MGLGLGPLPVLQIFRGKEPLSRSQSMRYTVFLIEFLCCLRICPSEWPR